MSEVFETQLNLEKFFKGVDGVEGEESVSVGIMDLFVNIHGDLEFEIDYLTIGELTIDSLAMSPKLIIELMNHMYKNHEDDLREEFQSCLDNEDYERMIEEDLDNN